jgi:hypothetical protein
LAEKQKLDNKPLFLSQMKRVLAIIAFSIYLFGTTEISQLLKLPFLVNHYLEHANQNKSTLSFIQYLQLHYNNHTQSHEDHHKESQLPFKSVDDCCMAGHISIPASEINLQSPSYEIITANYTSYKACDYIQITTGDIFQPPRL